MTRKVNIALEIKWGIVNNILHNAIIVGESPYMEFDSLQEALAYMMENNLPFRGTKAAYEVIADVDNLKAYASEMGLQVEGTVEEIRNQLAALQAEHEGE